MYKYASGFATVLLSIAMMPTAAQAQLGGLVDIGSNGGGLSVEVLGGAVGVDVGGGASLGGGSNILSVDVLGNTANADVTTGNGLIVHTQVLGKDVVDGKVKVLTKEEALDARLKLLGGGKKGIDATANLLGKDKAVDADVKIFGGDRNVLDVDGDLLGLGVDVGVGIGLPGILNPGGPNNPPGGPNNPPGGPNTPLDPGNPDQRQLACVGSDGSNVLNLIAQMRYDQRSVQAWGRASGVQVVKVPVCADARGRIRSAVASNGNLRAMQQAAASDALIAASVSRSAVALSNVVGVTQKGGQLTVYVY